jgi:hypothetical protein
MGLGTLVKDILTVGGTARRRNKKAKRQEREADALIAQNTALAQQMFDRDRGSTAFAGMQADPAMVAAQQRSLGEMQARSQDGYTPLDRQAMQQQLNDVARYEQSQRASLAQDARARGVTGSGMDIASQLAAQQSGADRAMATGTDMALAGRDRAYQANADAGNLAGQMRGQQFGEQAQVAGATDQYGQWRIGQQSQDAGMLMDARLGLSSNLNDRAQQARDAFSEGVDQAVQIGGAVANAYTGGAAGVATSAATGRTAAPATGSTRPAALGGGGTAPPAARIAGPFGTAGARPPALGGAPAPVPQGAPLPAPTARRGLPRSNARRRGPSLLPTPQGGIRG